MHEWIMDLYQRLRPGMSPEIVREYDELALYDQSEFEATVILDGIESGIMTDEDKDQAASLVRSSNGITFRKLRHQLLHSLDRDLIPT